MVIFLTWLSFYVGIVVQAVRFNDRILEKKRMKKYGDLLDLKSLNKRQYISGQIDWSEKRPLIRGSFGPIATLRNIEESRADAEASVHGLSVYDGDVIVPPVEPKVSGRQVSIDADKMSEGEQTHGSLFDFFHKRPNLVRKETEEMSRKNNEEIWKSISKKKKEGNNIMQKNKETSKLRKKTGTVGNDEHLKLRKKKNIVRDDSYTCFLPKIVVKTRLAGPLVINEVKVYGDSKNEQSVHKFISTHLVSANETELVNEFVMPPQFFIGVSPDILKSNDADIANVAIYLKNGQLDLSHKIYQTPSPAVHLSEKSYTMPTPSIKTTKLSATTISSTTVTTSSTPGKNILPTYNPFLPTEPNADKSNKNPKWNGDIISDIIQKKSQLNSKDHKNFSKDLLIWLNTAARHRNRVADIAAGDANAYTGYEMTPATTSS